MNFQCSLRSLLWDWNSFSYVRLWTFLNATLSKIGTEQCWFNLQTCLSANPQCSCCSSLVARWSSSFYWGCLGNFCLFRSCWVHRDHIGTIPRYHIKCIDLLQLLVWPSLSWFTATSWVLWGRGQQFGAYCPSGIHLTQALKHRKHPMPSKIKSDSSSDFIWLEKKQPSFKMDIICVKELYLRKKWRTTSLTPLAPANCQWKSCIWGNSKTGPAHKVILVAA